MEIYAARTFPALFIFLDLGWLCIFIGFLLVFRKYQALIVGGIAGIIYFIVDYGYFYSVLHTRVVTGADTFWLLFWMSFSYGLTNFAWMWLLFERGKHWKEWSLLIIFGWIAVAFASQNFGSAFPVITTNRGTGTYHGIMAIILFIGYAIQIFRNLGSKDTKEGGVNLLWLLGIGVGIQFAWEAVLLLAGIRPAHAVTLIVNSLIETNLGVPYAFWIFSAMNRKKKPD
ncbi:MAG: hypothetical protein JW904_04055 [Spirochaetales bacterium]|nr:hypothetical protein [Spirochaetales bacterium]